MLFPQYPANPEDGSLCGWNLWVKYCTSTRTLEYPLWDSTSEKYSSQSGSWSTCRQIVNNNNPYCSSFGKQTLKWKPLILYTDFWLLHSLVCACFAAADAFEFAVPFFWGDVDSQDSTSMCKLKHAGFPWSSGDLLKTIWVKVGCVLDGTYASSQSKVSQAHAIVYFLFSHHSTMRGCELWPHKHILNVEMCSNGLDQNDWCF